MVSLEIEQGTASAGEAAKPSRTRATQAGEPAERGLRLVQGPSADEFRVLDSPVIGGASAGLSAGDTQEADFWEVRPTPSAMRVLDGPVIGEYGVGLDIMPRHLVAAEATDEPMPTGSGAEPSVLRAKPSRRDLRDLVRWSAGQPLTA